MEYNVKHNKERKQFEIELGHLAVVNYTKQNGYYAITHTGVPHAFRGKGIAGILNKALLDYIREEGAKVLPLCPYTETYIERHPEYQDMVIKR